jgi:hypothetical protein
MRRKAKGTFLWAALVFKELQDLEDAECEDRSDVLKIRDPHESRRPRSMLVARWKLHATTLKYIAMKKDSRPRNTRGRARRSGWSGVSVNALPTGSSSPRLRW